MRRKVLIVALVLIGALAVVTVGAAPTRKSALVRFTTPTIVAGAIVMGTVVFEHDDSAMSRGESCTTVYSYDTWKNERGNAIVDFMCEPRERSLAMKFEATCSRAFVTGPHRLLEYQFAGDTEGHGVPER
jgi:hypothetical protein